MPKGEWPTVIPDLPTNCRVIRKVAVFNDELSDDEVTLTWKLLSGDKSGKLLSRGEVDLNIPLGEFVTQDVPRTPPRTPEK